jgi:hypothetical protein
MEGDSLTLDALGFEMQKTVHLSSGSDSERYPTEKDKDVIEFNRESKTLYSKSKLFHSQRVENFQLPRHPKSIRRTRTDKAFSSLYIFCHCQS